MGDSQQVLGAGIAAHRRGGDIGQGFLAGAALEQQQAIIVRRLHVALRRSLGIERFGLFDIGFDPAAKPVGLPHVELRVGITLCGGPGPLAHGPGKVSCGPGIDPGLDVGMGRHRGQARQRQHSGHPSCFCRMSHPIPFALRGPRNAPDWRHPIVNRPLAKCCQGFCGLGPMSNRHPVNPKLGVVCDLHDKIAADDCSTSE